MKHHYSSMMHLPVTVLRSTVASAALTVVLCLTSSAAMAGTVSQSKAQSFANRFLKAHGLSSNTIAVNASTAGAKGMNGTFDGASDPAYYIFNAASITGSPAKGYVIVSGEEEMPSLLGYSLDGSWPQDESAVPTPLRNALQNYAAYVQSVRDGKAVAAEGKESASYEGTPVVGPLLTTAWAQNYPYNMYAGEIPDSMLIKPFYCGHYPAGCVAIAIGQMLNYWGQKEGKPECPNDHDTYALWDNWFKDNGQSCEIDTLFFSLSSSTKYDWANIPDSIGHRADTLNVMSQEQWDKKSKAVGTLIRDVAYAMNMKWKRVGGNHPGGGADDQYCPDVLTQVFNFSPECYTILTNGYGTEYKYLDLIKADLDKGRPVIAKGDDAATDSGHCFVYDGYDDNDLIHVNWGWGGMCNNFFDVRYLKTDMYDTSTGRNYNFSTNQGIILNIHPMAKGEVVTPKLDNKNIQLILTQFSVKNAEGKAISKMDTTVVDYKGMTFPAVAYSDKSINTVETKYYAASYHKSFGYDYDIQMKVTNMDDGTVLQDSTTHDTNLKVPSIAVSGDLTNNISFPTSQLPDGKYMVTGAMREILNGENGEWKAQETDDTIRIAGNDVIMNPDVYDKYYHGKECIHYCPNDSNQMYVHMEFTKDPENIHVGDTLYVILERQFSNNCQLGDMYIGASDKILLTAKADDMLIPDTLLADTKGVGEHLAKCMDDQTMAQHTFVKANAKRIVIEKADAGHTIRLSYSIPVLGLYMTNDIKVAQATGVKEIEPAGSKTGNTCKYNLAGQQVGSRYRGIVIKDGKKVVNL